MGLLVICSIQLFNYFFNYVRLILLTFCFIECDSVQCCRKGKCSMEVFVLVVLELPCALRTAGRAVR